MGKRRNPRRAVSGEHEPPQRQLITIGQVRARYPLLPASTLKFMRKRGRVRAEPDPVRPGQFLFDAADLARELDGRIFRTPPTGGNIDRIEHDGRALVRVQAIPATYGFSLMAVASWQRHGHLALGGARLAVHRVQFVGLIGPPRDYADAAQLDRIKQSLEPAASLTNPEPDPDQIGLPEAIASGLTTRAEASVYADCGMQPRVRPVRNSPALADDEHPDGRPIRAGNRLVIRNGRQVREGWLSRRDLAEHAADLSRPGWLTEGEVRALDGLGLRPKVGPADARRGEVIVFGCRVAIRQGYARIVANRTSPTGPPGSWRRVWLFNASDLRPAQTRIKAAMAKGQALIDGRGNLWVAETEIARFHGRSPAWLRRAWLAGRIGRTVMASRKGRHEGKPSTFIYRERDIQSRAEEDGPTSIGGGWSPDADLVARAEAADLLKVKREQVTVAVSSDPSLAESTGRGSRVYLWKVREYFARNVRGGRCCEKGRDAAGR